MALVKTSPLIAAISGNVPGANFATTPYGAVARARKPKPPPPTSDQLHARRAFQLCRATWRTLTDDQRTAWRTFASNSHYVNRIGITRNLTGQQYFIQTNFYFAILDWPLHSNPPPLQLYFWPNHIILTVVAPNEITVHNKPSYAAPGLPMYVSGSRPFTDSPPSHHSRWATLGLFTTDASGLVYVGPAFVARFGSLQTGEYIGIRSKVIAIDWPHTPTHESTAIAT